MADPIVYRRHVHEDRLDGRRLGRHVVHDERSREYPAHAAKVVRSVKHKALGLPLDQLQIGKCTCEALAGAVNSQPDYKGGHVLDDSDTDRLYELETQLEGQPWSPAAPTENDIGGSGLMVCRAAKKLGLVRLYRHAFGLDHALRALVLRPVIFGVDWYDGFDSPDREGIVQISGSIRGGHEICALGIDAPRGLVEFAQSWGKHWGVADTDIGLPDGGAFYVPFEDLDRLLAQQGDATVPYV